MADWDLPRDPLAALGAGDPGPFEDFVRSYARRFYHYFRRLGAGPHRAEDLTQEVFLKLHERAHRYQPEKRFRAFCFSVARNQWIDDCRRRGVRPDGRSLEAAVGEPRRAAESPGPRPAEDPFERAALRDEDRRVRAALEELGEGHRAVFELGVIEELPYPEIAEILDIPVGTVKSRMFHAVRKLRERLADERGEAGEGGAA